MSQEGSQALSFSNPRPEKASSQCPFCNCSTLAPLTVCGGGGMHLTNWGRWFQKCTASNCGKMKWHNPPTPLAWIPQDVQMRFALRQTADEADVAIVCNEPNCMTANNTRRKANKLCDRAPQRCSQCCKNDGGCRLPGHRVNTQSSMSLSLGSQAQTLTQSQPQFQPQSQFEGLDAASQPVNTSSTGNPPPRTHYARPFDPSYANPYKEAHRAREERNNRFAAQRALLEQKNNTVTVKLWVKPHSEPKCLRIVQTTFGIFVPSEHNVVVTLLAGTPSPSLIEVFQITSVASSVTSTEWTIQEISVPIETNPMHPVLIRALGVDLHDSMGLDYEISSVLAASDSAPLSPASKDVTDSAPLSPAPKDVTAAATPTPSPTSSPSPPQVEYSRSGTNRSQLIRPVPFPRTYTFDMARGMEAMLLLQSCSAEELKEAFSIHFPGCKYMRKTFYKHRLIFTKAKKAGVLSSFIAAGRVEEGRWVNMIAELKRVTAANEAAKADDQPPTSLSPVSSPPSLAPGPGPTLSGSEAATAEAVASLALVPAAIGFVPPGEGDDENDYECTEVLVEYFKIEETVTLYADNLTKNPIIWQLDPFYQGSRKNIRIVICPWEKDGSGNVTTDFCVAKMFNLPGEWWEPAPNKEIVMWLEGARLEQGRYNLRWFKSTCSATGTTIHPISFVKTFLMSSAILSAVGQPRILGTEFTLKSLQERELSLACDTLEAFSHHTYEDNDGESVFVDFQGHIMSDGTLSLYDCQTHFKDKPIEQPLVWFSMGNKGNAGIEMFKTNHRCNSVYKSLGLRPLTL